MTERHVSAGHRARTRGMLAMYVSMQADEPPQDAGGHPSAEVHMQVGKEWADWDRRRRAWATLLVPRLLSEAVDDLLGGPDSRPYPEPFDAENAFGGKSG